MTTPAKRGRACEACSKLKIKCELGSTPGTLPPCQRCVRLSKECALTPAKGNKERMAELEAQVVHLTRLLEANGIQDPRTPPRAASSQDNSEPSPQPDTASKKRRVDRASEPEDGQTSTVGSRPLLERIDEILTLKEQGLLLVHYTHSILPHFPLVPLESDYTLSSLRAEQPLMLLAVSYVSCLFVLDSCRDDGIAGLFLDELAHQVSAETDASNVTLLAALQVACLWYRVPTKKSRASLNNLLKFGFEITSGSTATSALAGKQASIMSQVLDAGTLNSQGMWRNNLVCFALATSKSILIRDSPPPQWSSQNEGCSLGLAFARPPRSSDAWLLTYVRAERLCGRIASTLCLHNTKLLDITTSEAQAKLDQCRQEILDWKLALPSPAPAGPCLLFWQHVAIAYMHEPILHTSTNRSSFTAPFVADRLATTDFPAPAIVTPEHAASLFELKEALHNVVDAFAGFETEVLHAFSGFSFTSRAAYALYLLAKLHIAVTARNNTYSRVLDAESVQLDLRIQQLLRVHKRLMRSSAPSSTSSRIFNMTASMETWLSNYNEASGLSSPWTSDSSVQIEQPWTSASASQSDIYGVESLDGMPWNFGPNELALETMFSAQSMDPRLFAKLE